MHTDRQKLLVVMQRLSTAGDGQRYSTLLIQAILICLAYLFSISKLSA